MSLLFYHLRGQFFIDEASALMTFPLITANREAVTGN